MNKEEWLIKGMLLIQYKAKLLGVRNETSRSFCLNVKAFLIFQELTKFFHSTGTVADGILDIIAQFGKSQVISFWYEDWVITKTGSPPLFSDDFTFHDSFEKVFFTIHD